MKMSTTLQWLQMLTVIALLFSVISAISIRDTDSSTPVYPTTVKELFSDVYNNNSVSQYLLTRVPLFKTPNISELVPGGYFAYNYAMGNSLWVVTPDQTIIIVDCPETIEMAQQMVKDMRKIPAIGNKPITTIIFTIFQADHTWGARAFAEDPVNAGNLPTIIGHKNLIQQAEFFDMFIFLKTRRVFRQFGRYLPESIRIDAWKPLLLNGKKKYMDMWPSVLLDMNNFGETQDMIIDGLPIEFVFIPGYTTDQLAVWFPTMKLMACADTFYFMFPNMYTIRGEPPRDALGWSKAARVVRSYMAEAIAPNHELPLVGRNAIADALEKVADAMQFVHDQTVRLLGQGMLPDAISTSIKLPASLDNEPSLAQVYGCVETASKAVADHYTGWFNGEAEDLLPVNKDDYAAKMVRDFGRDAIVRKARAAYEQGEYRWAATLASFVWRVEKQQNDALYWRTQAFKRLADNSINVPIRQYLYSSALLDWELIEGLDKKMVIESRPTFLYLHTIDNCFTLLQVHLDPVKAEGVSLTFDVHLDDDVALKEDEVYRLRLRNSVLAVERVSGINLHQPGTLRTACVASDVSTWRLILAGKMNVDEAITTNKLRVLREGVNFKDFFAMFDFNDHL